MKRGFFLSLACIASVAFAALITPSPSRADTVALHAPADKVSTHSKPAAPSNLTAVATGPHLIALAWHDNSQNETGFKIKRRTKPTGAFSLLVKLGANTTAYSDTGVNPGTTYDYEVKAFNASGASPFSNIASATPSPAVVAVSVSPPSATLLTHATQPFTATVTGTADTAVNWSMQEGPTGAARSPTRASTRRRTPPVSTT